MARGCLQLISKHFGQNGKSACRPLIKFPCKEDQKRILIWSQKSARGARSGVVKEDKESAAGVPVVSCGTLGYVFGVFLPPKAGSITTVGGCFFLVAAIVCEINLRKAGRHCLKFRCQEKFWQSLGSGVGFLTLDAVYWWCRGRSPRGRAPTWSATEPKRYPNVPQEAPAKEQQLGSSKID